nr:unnamed protein product [Callosobruchus analis]
MEAANERSVKPCESKYTTPRILAIFYSFAFQKKESSLAQSLSVGRFSFQRSPALIIASGPNIFMCGSFRNN